MPDLIVRFQQRRNLAAANHLDADEAFSGVNPALFQIILNRVDLDALFLQLDEVFVGPRDSG